MARSSRISGFYNLTPAERRRIVADWAPMSPDQAAAAEELLRSLGGLSLEQADKMVENVVGAYALPLGIATNFVVNGRDVLVPMVDRRAVGGGRGQLRGAARARRWWFSRGGHRAADDRPDASA